MTTRHEQHLMKATTKKGHQRKQRDQFERKRQPQSGLVLLEWLIVAAMVAIVVATAISFEVTSNRFISACNEAGGKAVYDGRQYQCLKRQPQE